MVETCPILQETKGILKNKNMVRRIILRFFIEKRRNQKLKSQCEGRAAGASGLVRPQLPTKASAVIQRNVMKKK
jgi:hypothetical protein